ncbi:MAG: phosphoribosyl-AMP cyclohydrolase [Balneolales bacterium]|nr:phosphoribosyl-AMP cyclohydrolase [Balneolales bacterium]
MNTKLDFEKTGGLIPVIIQHADTLQVLMLGYMNEEAWELTMKTGKVTFYSRSRNSIWVKGETSGNYLHLHDYFVDCDNDTILITALPVGPTCHRGTTTCFDVQNTSEEVTKTPPARTQQ